MTEALLATTRLGEIRGTAEGGLAVFRGVPYATAARFQPPQALPPWDTPLDATQHGPVAPQAPSRLRVAMGDPSVREMGEACLNLTIWTPGADAAGRPVLVWLHGGAWMTGAGSLDWYDGSVLAREGGIVVVGVNYRLGALGYARHPAFSPGNLGTLDQAAALAWVRDHIAAFGGDPAQVTVGGQSAGASSIGRLMLDPAARALFRRAILQSGGFGRAPLDAKGAEEIGAAFLDLLGIDPAAADVPQRLAALPADAIVAAQGALARSRARFGDTNPPFMPSLDQPMTESALLQAIAAASPGLEILIGTTHDESHAFFAADPAMASADPAAVAALFDGDQSLGWYQARRPGGKTADLIADLGSNQTFIWPSMQLAGAAVEQGATVYAYQFTWAAPGSPFKSCHCVDLPFLFGTFDHWPGAPMLANGDRAAMAALGQAMRRSWLNFVRSGAPGQPELDWPAYSAQQRETMLVGDVWRVVNNAAALP